MQPTASDPSKVEGNSFNFKFAPRSILAVVAVIMAAVAVLPKNINNLVFMPDEMLEGIEGVLVKDFTVEQHMKTLPGAAFVVVLWIVAIGLLAREVCQCYAQSCHPRESVAHHSLCVVPHGPLDDHSCIRQADALVHRRPCVPVRPCPLGPGQPQPRHPVLRADAQARQQPDLYAHAALGEGGLHCPRCPALDFDDV